MADGDLRGNRVSMARQSVIKTGGNNDYVTFKH